MLVNAELMFINSQKCSTMLINAQRSISMLIDAHNTDHDAHNNDHDAHNTDAHQFSAMLGSRDQPFRITW